MTGEEERDRLRRRLRAVHRAARIGSWEGGFGGASMRWSAEARDITGWPADRDPAYHDLVRLVHPDDRPAFFEARDAALAGEKPYETDLRLLRPDGEIRHVHIAAEIERDGHGQPVRLVGVTQDRTEEIELLRRLRVTEASRRQILERLLDATDRERDRLARQLSAGAAAQLRQVEATMAAEVDRSSPAAWQEALESVRRSIASLDATLSAIADQGTATDLATVVAELAADAGPGLQVTSDVDVGGPLRPAVRSVVVRLVQEALQNVRKHANATCATVAVRRDGDELHVRVSDDGCGFDPEALHGRRGHFGLASLREDVAALEGRLHVGSGPGGTVLEAQLPAG